VAKAVAKATASTATATAENKTVKTALVILNWNTRGYLERWLPALVRTCADVWVADNASTDSSLELLADKFPEVRTIPLDRNYGFTGGYNLAMARVCEQQDYEYLVLVNTDVDVPYGWLEPLEKWMDTHPECGVCGPKLYAMGPDFSRTDKLEYAGAAGGCLDRFGYPFCRGRVPGRTDTDRGQYGSPADVLWISGACMMTRASLWKEAGGLDGRFFAHMEEIDYCWRVQLKGWKVNVVPESRVWHLGGGTLPQTSPFKLKLNFRNNMLMLDKNLEATFRAQGCPAGKAASKARRVLAIRNFLNCCSAAVYLLSGKKASFKAVKDARREFLELEDREARSTDFLRVPDGMYDIPILLVSAFKRDRIFKYLLNYEYSHCRCR